MPFPAEAMARLGALLTGTQAEAMAERLESGWSLTDSLGVVPTGQRRDVRQAISAAELGTQLATLAAVCRAIHGARSGGTTLEPAWTLPGHLAQTGPLTSSASVLVARATTSITCSTFNFQRTSGLWAALHEAAQRLRSAVRVYIDTAASGPGAAPTAGEIAAHLHPGQVSRTVRLDGRLVRNHAKFLVVDHRFVVIGSANFSMAAEQHNVELGVRVDDRSLAESVERQLRAVESTLYERVQ